MIQNTYIGNNGNPYYIYENTDLKTAPVVVFLHGYESTPPDPKTYGGWIQHLVNKGNTVIYPMYYAPKNNNTAQYTANAKAAILSAYQSLSGNGHVNPNGSISVIGHSLGAVVAVNFANDANTLNLPQPKAIMLANGADSNVIVPMFKPIQYSSYSAISNLAQIMFVVGSDDTVAGTSSLSIYNKLTQLNTKWLAMLNSAQHRLQRLKADHFAPLSKTTDNTLLGTYDSNQLDTGGYWKLFDDLQNAVNNNVNLNLGTTFSLGRWSDGTDITPVCTVQTGPTL